MSKEEKQTAPNTVDLDSLSLEQLNGYKTQEEGRLQAITQRYAQLRNVHARLNAAKNALSYIPPTADGKDIMVPLTASLYVPGKVREPNKVMVDLGTGFYVEKTSKDAMAFLERKGKLVDANSQNMMNVIQVTRQNLDSVSMAMQGKMLEIRARQEGMRHQTSS